MTADSSPTAPPRDDVDHRAMVATYVAFIGAGVGISTWASRIPQVRDRLELEPSELGLLLLCIAVGSLVALPLSGPIAERLGPRRMVAAGALVLAGGMVTAAVGYRVGVAPVAVGLFMFGFAAGGWDVGMNVEGAEVERRLGRSIMSRFHAGFSVGTVAGALVGTAMVALDVDVTVHLLIVAVVLLFVVVNATRSFLPDSSHVADPAVGSADAERGAFAAWREPRTLAIGLMVLAFTFAEGTATDWIGVALVDTHGAAKATGTLVFALFLASMTAGRWFGPGLLDRHGRVPVVRALGLIGIAGTLLFVTSANTAVAAVGAVLWGIGASLGFPVGMSAAAEDPARAAGRVSVVASIGYCAFLSGPPLVGFLGDRGATNAAGDAKFAIGALFAVTTMLMLATLLAPTVKPTPAAS